MCLTLILDCIFVFKHAVKRVNLTDSAVSLGHRAISQKMNVTSQSLKVYFQRTAVAIYIFL